MATTINTAYTNSGSGYSVTYDPNDGVLSTVTITASGTYAIVGNGANNAVDNSLLIRLTVRNTTVNINNSIFNRQTTINLSSSTQILNFNNLTSYSGIKANGLYDDNNIKVSGSGGKVNFASCNLYAIDTCEPISVSSSAAVNFTNTDIYLAYYNVNKLDEDGVTITNNFSYQLNHENMCKQCRMQVGFANPIYPISISINNGQTVNAPLNLHINETLSIVDTVFDRTFSVNVPNGKALTFSGCVLNEYHAPQGTPYDPALMTLTNSGSVFFTHSKMLPRVDQTLQIADNRIIAIDGLGASLNNINGDSTLLIHHLPADYSNFDSLYSAVAYVKNSTIDIDNGSYIFGTLSVDPVTFNLNFQADASNNSIVTVYTDGGNISYTRLTADSNIVWSGYVIGSDVQPDGRTYAFNTVDVLDASGAVISAAKNVDISGLILVAAGGNNVLNPTAIKGTWTGSNLFSYYPNTTSDHSYNLLLDHEEVVGTGASPKAIPLYNGSESTYSYNFYADNTYRPNFYLGQSTNSLFDLSANGTSTLHLKLVNSVFGKGLDLSLGSVEDVFVNGSSFTVAGGSCIAVASGSQGSITLNTDNLYLENDFYISADTDKLVNTSGSTTGLTVNYNKYHLSYGTWNFNATGLTTYKGYISTDNSGSDDTTGRKGTICLDGSYQFTNVPDLELNFLTEGEGALINTTTFTQTIYVWGSSDLTLNNNTFQGLTTANFNGNIPSSVAGTELINLSSLSGDRDFGGRTITFSSNNRFYLPHGKKCIYPFNSDYVSNLNINTAKVYLTSFRHSYFITSASEPLSYYLGKVLLDNTPANDVTIFGADASTPVDKAFTVETTGSTSDQYLTGRFMSLVVRTSTASHKTILGYPQSAIGRITESNLKVLHLDGSMDISESRSYYALDITSGIGNYDVDVENVYFHSPGSIAYFSSTVGSRIDFTSTTNTFDADNGTTKHVGIIRATGANAVIDLGNETFPDAPVVAYNKFFWPNLGDATNIQPLISSQGYVAESWTNDPDYYNYDMYDTTNPTELYFTHSINGLAKPYSRYGLGTWGASESNYHDLYFYVAFGLSGENTFDVSLNHTENFESYIVGAIYDTDMSGVKTKSYSNAQYKQGMRLRFKDNFTNLALNSRDVVATFAQGGSDLWTVEPVPLTYKIVSNVTTANFALTTQVTPNGGVNWYNYNDVAESNGYITVSESEVNGTANIRFVYADSNSDVLRFLYDTSLNFAVDISFMAVGPDTDLNNYVLSWPALNTSSNTLETQPLKTGEQWTVKSVTANHSSGDDVSFNVHNIDDQYSLLVSSSTSFTGPHRTLTLEPSYQASYDIINNEYTVEVSFYMMTHVLPKTLSGFNSLTLTSSISVSYDGDVLPGIEVSPAFTVSGQLTTTPSLAHSDMAVPFNVVFTIPNSNLTVGNTYGLTLTLDDAPGQGEPVLDLSAATVNLSFDVPLLYYINYQQGITDQNFNVNISKATSNSLYVYLNSNASSDSTINFTLSDAGNLVNIDTSVTILAGESSGNTTFTIAEDNKIWGDVSLNFSADVTLVNAITYNYSESQTHEIRVNFGRAIDLSGNESTDASLPSLAYPIYANNQSDRVPNSWVADDGTYYIDNNDFADHIPISKYTPYFIEVEVKSKGFDATNIQTDSPPNFTIMLTDPNNSNNPLSEGTDYVVNTSLPIINMNGTDSRPMTDIINDVSPNKRLYFRLNPNVSLAGDSIRVYIVFTDYAGTNYQNLPGSFEIADISYTGADGNMTSTAFFETAGLRANTWRILPSGDGKYLEFYHDSKSRYITRLGVDASFHPYVAPPPYYRPGGQFNNGHQIQNYVAGQNGLYTIYDPVNNVSYGGYVVHGFGSASELNDPWLVLVSTDSTGDVFASFGQGSSGFYDMSYRDDVPEGDGIYQPFKYFKAASKVGLVTNSLTSTDPTYWKTFALTTEDNEWNTGNYSVYDALYTTDQFLTNAGQTYTNNDTVFQEPSIVNVTAMYSGEADAGSLQLTRTGTELGDGTQDLNYFVMTGDFYQGDNDTVAMSFINRRPMDTVNLNGNDDYHGENQYGTKWTFWNNDFHSNSQNQRIGNTADCYAGLIIGEDAPNGSKVAYVIAK